MDGYLTSDKALENAPKDLTEQDVDDVFGGKVRIRSLTAAQSAAVQQSGIRQASNGRGNPSVSIADMEIKQFELGVVIPKFEHNEVVRLYQQSGPSFKRVCEAIDEISGTNKKEFLDAQAAFPGPDPE